MLDRRRRQLLADIASGAGLASALSALSPLSPLSPLSSCGGGGPDGDAALRAVNATMDVAGIDVQFNDWRFANAVAYSSAAGSHVRRNLWAMGPRGRFKFRRAGRSPILLRDTKTLPKHNCFAQEGP
jgi:hypothetical protein